MNAATLPKSSATSPTFHLGGGDSTEGTSSFRRSASLIKSQSFRRISQLYRSVRYRRKSGRNDANGAATALVDEPGPSAPGSSEQITIVEEEAEWIVEPTPMTSSLFRQFRNFVAKKTRPTLKYSRPSVDECPLMATFAMIAEFERDKERQSLAQVVDPHDRHFSLEKRRRSHRSFLVGHHARTTLFCPEQASQVELEFLAETHRQFILFVRAPNGERSPMMHFHGFGQRQNFNPEEVGCGHGVWHVDILVRSGPRFVVANSTSVNLRGCGVLTYGIDHNLQLKLREQLWLML